MKKELLLTSLLVSLATTGVSIAATDGCGELNDYDVQKTSFSGLSLSDAMSKLTDGMPFQVSVSGGEDMKISANGVAGPLDGVLNKLAKEVGFSYTKDRCQIKVSAVAPKEIWRIRTGDKISSVMSSWCKANGWSLVWDAPEIVAEADVAVEGKFEGVIEMIVEALNRGGAGVRALLYDANHVLRITEKNQ